jgi:hypothetical protein
MAVILSQLKECRHLFAIMTSIDTDNGALTVSEDDWLSDPDVIRLFKKIKKWLALAEKLREEENATSYSTFKGYSLLAMLHEKMDAFGGMFPETMAFDPDSLSQNEEYYLDIGNGFPMQQMIRHGYEMVKFYKYFHYGTKAINLARDGACAIQEIKVLGQCNRIRLFLKQGLEISSATNWESRELYWPIYETHSNIMRFPKPLILFGEMNLAFSIESDQPCQQVRVSCIMLNTVPRQKLLDSVKVPTALISEWA